MAFCCSSLSASAVLTVGLAISSGSGGGSSSIRSRRATGPPNFRLCTTLAAPMRVVCMAPEEEKMTRRSPLDFPIVLGQGGYRNRTLPAMFRDVKAITTTTRSGRDQSLDEDLIYFPNSVQ